MLQSRHKVSRNVLLKMSNTDASLSERTCFCTIQPLHYDHSRPSLIVFRGLKKLRVEQTNRRRTDRPSYRDAWTHLKKVIFFPKKSDHHFGKCDHFPRRNIILPTFGRELLD